VDSIKWTPSQFVARVMGEAAEHIGEEGTHLRHGPAHYKKLGIDVRTGRAIPVLAGPM